MSSGSPRWKDKGVCSFCGGRIEQRNDFLKDGMSYTYHACANCGEEYLDMAQLHEVAERYRKMKQERAKVSKWGASLGVRLPKALAKRHNLKAGDEVSFISEKDSIRIVPV